MCPYLMTEMFLKQGTDKHNIPGTGCLHRKQVDESEYE